MVSVVVPSEGRAAQLRLMISSCLLSAAGEVEVVVVAGAGVAEYEWAKCLARPKGRVRVVPRVSASLSGAWNDGCRFASGTLFLLCGNDVVFRSPGWDVSFAAAFDAWPDRLGVVWCDDGSGRGKHQACHPCISREWFDLLGYGFPPGFDGDMPDAWLKGVAEACGRWAYLPGVLLEHRHPVLGKAKWDEQYWRRQELRRQGTCERQYRFLSIMRQAAAWRVREVTGGGDLVDSDAAFRAARGLPSKAGLGARPASVACS